MAQSEVAKRYEEIRAAIDAKLATLGRPKESVLLVAVSKTHPAETVRDLFQACKAQGRRVVFGENYVQEFKKKRAELPSELECHYIGHLQRNKARDAVRFFSVVESVDSAELAQALDAEAAKEGKLQKIYLQVNVSRDSAKAGFQSEAVVPFVRDTLPQLKNISLAGLMTITALYEDPEEARPDFRALRTLRDSLGNPALALSMGMSSDYLIAIEEGATVVRVGTAIFGTREKA